MFIIRSLVSELFFVTHPTTWMRCHTGRPFTLFGAVLSNAVISEQSLQFPVP